MDLPGPDAQWYDLCSGLTAWPSSTPSIDIDDLELGRAFAREVERLLFAELRRPRRPFRPL